VVSGAQRSRGNAPLKRERSVSSKSVVRRSNHRRQGDAVAKDSRTNEDNVQKNILFDSNREALIPTLKEFQRRIEHLATYLEDLELESLALRSAAENIEYVIERLRSVSAGLKQQHFRRF
jgi:outer membrane protein OmpA-like peptidoglycan-associated protein